MTSKKQSAGDRMPATYEAALAELESLVQTLESGQTPLDQLLESYRRGSELLEFCKERLASVEQQIRVLDASGQQTGEAVGIREETSHD